MARGSPPRRCVSGSGLAWPPLMDGINVFMTDTARDDEVFGSHSILMHNGARGMPNGHPRAGGLPRPLGSHRTRSSRVPSAPQPTSFGLSTAFRLFSASMAGWLQTECKGAEWRVSSRRLFLER